MEMNFLKILGLVFPIITVFVFFFVIVFWLVRSCLKWEKFRFVKKANGSESWVLSVPIVTGFVLFFVIGFLLDRLLSQMVEFGRKSMETNFPEILGDLLSMISDVHQKAILL